MPFVATVSTFPPSSSPFCLENKWNEATSATRKDGKSFLLQTVEVFGLFVHLCTSTLAKKNFVRLRWNFELEHNRRPGMKFDERLKLCLWFRTRSRVHLLFIFDIYSAQGLFSLNVSQG